MGEITVDEILELIRKSGLNQAELAKRAEISQSTLSRVLGGKTDNPHQATMARIKDVLEAHERGIVISPKAFISYSWSGQLHRDRVRQWAELLISDGVQVILDQFDLNEGQDKFAFMERMVTDPQITHVLVVCDQKYVDKADKRKAGVGTESQIISSEVYSKVEQSKFIPVVVEFDDAGSPYLPAFLKSRIWLDFSSPDAVNENWERLIRLLYGRPLNVKPKLGSPPAYIINERTLPSPVRAKFSALKTAVLKGEPGVSSFRRLFLASCWDYLKMLEGQELSGIKDVNEVFHAHFENLQDWRDHFIEWVILESEARASSDFGVALLEALEKLMEWRSGKVDGREVRQDWRQAFELRLYEVFLYVVAALLKTKDFNRLHEVLFHQFLLPENERHGTVKFVDFDYFYSHAEELSVSVHRESRNYISVAAEIVRRSANRADFNFRDLMQADLLILLVAMTRPNIRYWYPQTLHYLRYGEAPPPFFLRCSQKKYFERLSVVTGVDDADMLRQAVHQGQERLGVLNWAQFSVADGFWDVLNMDALDTVA